MSEEQLLGGNSTVVVRIGDAVHRRAGPWSPAVHTLLRTLRAAGIEAVPEPRGFDAAGREVPSYGDAGPASPSNWRGRLQDLVAAYGSQSTVAELLAMMLTRLDHLAEHAEATAAGTGRADLAAHASMYRRDRTRIAGLI